MAEDNFPDKIFVKNNLTPVEELLFAKEEIKQLKSKINHLERNPEVLQLKRKVNMLEGEIIELKERKPQVIIKPAEPKGIAWQRLYESERVNAQLKESNSKLRAENNQLKQPK